MWSMIVNGWTKQRLLDVLFANLEDLAEAHAIRYAIESELRRRKMA